MTRVEVTRVEVTRVEVTRVEVTRVERLRRAPLVWDQVILDIILPVRDRGSIITGRGSMELLPVWDRGSELKMKRVH